MKIRDFMILKCVLFICLSGSVFAKKVDEWGGEFKKAKPSKVDSSKHGLRAVATSQKKKDKAKEGCKQEKRLPTVYNKM